jgi:hypothetical protein
MTESRSGAEESDSVAELSLDGMRVFTATTMEVYRQAALANYAEAEELLEKAIALREAGHALLDRAAVLAGQYAQLEDDHEEAVEEAFVATGGTDDDIPW